MQLHRGRGLVARHLPRLRWVEVDGIGEILGVSLFMALSLGTLSVAALARGGLPKWLAALGTVAAALLAALALPALRIDLQMPVAAAVSALSLWMLCAGVWLWRKH